MRHLSPREAYPFIVGAEVNFMEVVDNLRTFLDTGEDWERKNTSLQGVSIIKLPATRNRAASLAIEINPPDAHGRPMKKKGIMLMSRDEMLAFRKIFGSDKLEVLLNAVEEVIPEKKTAGKGSGDVIEI
ncbi:MAG TPA: hypothetical protein VMS89_02425 [Methanoregulaceae archaeon]|nr:hypothetical protein [Methanoregulaceae archaeon]